MLSLCLLGQGIIALNNVLDLNYVVLEALNWTMVTN